MKQKLVYIIGGSIVAGSLMFGGSAFAADNTRNWSGGRAPKSFMSSGATTPAIFGSVTAVSEEGITVSGKSGKQGTTTTYTVDVSKAKITEGLGHGASVVAPSKVEVGDKVAVLGTITGDAVVASAVFDKGSAPAPHKKRARSNQ